MFFFSRLEKNSLKGVLGVQHSANEDGVDAWIGEEDAMDMEELEEFIETEGLEMLMETERLEELTETEGLEVLKRDWRG